MFPVQFYWFAMCNFCYLWLGMKNTQILKLDKKKKMEK